MKQPKGVLTFKVDDALAKQLKGVPNRSEFIRTAILDALENTCPFCRGTGVLTPHRKKHWDELIRTHNVSACKSCDNLVFVCK
ncbi:MAG TPA: ribbon-helix-helix domain-containing protein [Candidatus Omnitrophota bacterium]|nr:ribbon-helix-helix domain-containing protein [Candidatus Omnitrophota bacterium]